MSLMRLCDESFESDEGDENNGNDESDESLLKEWRPLVTSEPAESGATADLETAGLRSRLPTLGR